MNIAIFTNNYLPTPYGVASSIASFHKQFEKSGHLVFIFAPFHKGYKDENPNVFRYPSLDLKYKISFPLAIPYSPKICAVLKKLKLDIIHSQHPTLLGDEAAKWARRRNIPLVFTWHNISEHLVHFVPLIPKNWAAWWINRKAVDYANNSDVVVAPTESAKNRILDLGVRNDKIIIIPTGVEEEVFLNPDRDKIRKKYAVADEEILLLLVSRLTQEKNLEFLFRAVINTLRSSGNVRFLVVGEGDILVRLMAMVSHNHADRRVTFTGIVSKEEIKNYYAAADIFVFALKAETQGLVTSEAMYMGLPVVAVRATGSQDLVEDGANGLLVSENEDEFAEAILKLIKDKQLRDKFAGVSKRIAREKYTSSVCAKNMLAVYEDAIKGYGAAGGSTSFSAAAGRSSGNPRRPRVDQENQYLLGEFQVAYGQDHCSTNRGVYEG